ncbi:MAG TPA: AraC family transcriptional regulator [Bacteroidetes bacterium]|nr:AraC family transcriptional regulator [Bacteroidota bacterium]
MQTSFKNYDAAELLEKVENDLGINLNTACQRTQFPLPKKIGEGNITTYLFRDGVSLFMFNGALTHDWEWEFDCEEDSPLFVFFSLSGSVEDAKKAEKDHFVLKPLDTLMVVHPGGSSRRSIIFKKGEPILLSVLRVDPQKFFDKKACCPADIPEKMRVLLSLSGEEIKCVMPPGRFTPEVALIVKEIAECPYSGLIRTTFVEAKTKQLLTIFMQQLELGQPNEGKKAPLAKSDLSKIEQAKHILTSDLQNPPTIEMLSRKVGLNRQKLKNDFKTIFKKTIYQYLIDQRMKMARQLMLEKKMSVQEVAVTVGYENASHFARRFQKHFGILPSQFLAMTWRKGQQN